MIKIYNVKSFCAKTLRFGLFIPFSNLILVYGRTFVPTSILVRISIARNRKIENKIKSIIGNIEDIEIQNDNIIKKNIWFCWLQGEDNMPLIPSMCLQSIKKNANGHDVVVVSLKNIDNYLKLSDRIKSLYQKGNITSAHLSDIIRIGLLSKYGGFWIDATMYLTSPISKDTFEQKLYSLKSQPQGFYVSKCQWSGFCFFMNQHSKLPHIVKNMLDNYWENEKWLIDYFMIDYLIDMAYNMDTDVKNDIDAIPFSNQELHSLSPLLCAEFDMDTFRYLTKSTSFFKLSWKMYSDEQLLANKNNYYHFLTNIVKN